MVFTHLTIDVFLRDLYRFDFPLDAKSSSSAHHTNCLSKDHHRKNSHLSHSSTTSSISPPTLQPPQAFPPLFNFYHTKPGIHPLSNSPGGIYLESSWWVCDRIHRRIEVLSLNSMALFERIFTDESTAASALVCTWWWDRK